MRLGRLLEALEDFQGALQRERGELPGDASQAQLAAKEACLVELPDSFRDLLAQLNRRHGYTGSASQSH